MEKGIIITPKKVNRPLYYLFGLLVLILNKIRYSIFGYKKTRTFSVSDIEQAVAYDVSVVNNLKDYLDLHHKKLDGLNVLELGVGADLGVGLLILAEGAQNYYGFDINNLAQQAPAQFYDLILDKILSEYGKESSENLRRELFSFLNNQPSRLHYLHDPLFNPLVYKNKKINLIFSQATLEHFTDLDTTFRQLSEIAEPGTVMINVIDFQTHTRFLRERDPLNIYRYSERLYHALRFDGIPNRMALNNYIEILKKFGWKEINILPLKILDDNYVMQIRPSLAKQFKSNMAINKMEVVLMCIKA